MEQDNGTPRTYEEAEEAMEELEKARSTIRDLQPFVFLGIATDEILNDVRNILTRPSMLLGALLDQPTLPPDIREKLATTSSDLAMVTRYTRLIHDIGHSASCSKSAYEVVGLKDLLDEVVTLAIHKARVHNKIIEFKVDAPLSRVDLPVAYVRHAVVNILSNSVDAMTMGSITVTADIHHNSVSIRICDTGSGMPPHVLAACRDAFFTTKPLDEATGLGLTIVTDLLQAINGTLTIQSIVGHGTCCTLSIPCTPGN